MRILLVHDDPRLARSLARGLRAHAYAVDEAADSDAARLHAGAHDYDLVVLDSVLPGRDGFAVCRALRACGVAAPVLMLTARDKRFDGSTNVADVYVGYLRRKLRAPLITTVRGVGFRLDAA